MSAYIVSKDHITYLVGAAMSRRISPHTFGWYHNNQRYELSGGDYDRAADVANMLWRENIASVSHRYPNESSSTLPGPVAENFIITPADVGHVFENFDPVQVLKSCHCYEYQTCEHDGWPTSESHAYIQSLISAAIHSLPGYEDAEWGAPEPHPTAIPLLHSLKKSNHA